MRIQLKNLHRGQLKSFKIFTENHQCINKHYVIWFINGIMATCCPQTIAVLRISHLSTIYVEINCIKLQLLEFWFFTSSWDCWHFLFVFGIDGKSWLKLKFFEIKLLALIIRTNCIVFIYSYVISLEITKKKKKKIYEYYYSNTFPLESLIPQCIIYTFNERANSKNGTAIVYVVHARVCVL